MEELAWGYGLVEALRVDDEDNVFFTDVLGGGVYRRSRDGEIATVVPKRRGVGGMLLHADGGVVVSGKDVAHVRDGETRVLLSVDGVLGFNDMTADASGRVVVGGLRFRPLAGEDPVPGGTWRIGAGGQAREMYGGIDWPNGIAFAPDGATLYHCEYAAGQILAHDVSEEGAANRRVFATSPSGAADGLAVDEEGGVWVATGAGGGLARFSPDGSLDEVLEVPSPFVATLAFGGADRRDLYIATAGNSRDPSRQGTLFRTRARVPGLPVPLARV